MEDLNLRKLSKGSTSYDFYTRIVPKGKNGLDIKEVNDGVEYIDNHQYSDKIITFLWDDDNYTDPNALKEDAEAKLEDLSKPQTSYSVDVIDLAKTGKDGESAEVHPCQCQLVTGEEQAGKISSSHPHREHQSRPHP